MDWNNLKNYRCPKDAALLKETESYHICTALGCTFKVNKRRFEELYEGLTGKDKEDEGL